MNASITFDIEIEWIGTTIELLVISRSIHFLSIHFSCSHMSYITFCFWRGQLSRQTNNISPADKEKFSSKYVNYSKIIDAISIMGQSNKSDSMKTNNIITQHLNFKNDMSLFYFILLIMKITRKIPLNVQFRLISTWFLDADTSCHFISNIEWYITVIVTINVKVNIYAHPWW